MLLAVGKVRDPGGVAQVAAHSTRVQGQMGDLSIGGQRTSAEHIELGVEFDGDAAVQPIKAHAATTEAQSAWPLALQYKGKAGAQP